MRPCPSRNDAASSSAPPPRTTARRPQAASGATVATIEALRHEHKRSAAHITAELAARGIVLDRRTVTRHLAALGPSRLACTEALDDEKGTAAAAGRRFGRTPASGSKPRCR
ncbi:hypothetical protein [Streptomonospora salina]|uniref:DNA-binding transcriptional ArsR family regulator n=1 Tax=Streptomonospora salina TaxID=104205 RepID=A0A841EF10_9ACTN|nr:DNA-binding transcriptional ArsR family regulator [Streptomonospora salina]